ncbi:berberine bridge enzyme-like 18 [Coffea eugenioides]|uniref:berberine bridge enzyme-like 18 n=1 Tax=Coffea eugenioides TaxID=49369 RepID=UPI000F60F0D5|nr:berberine bridge enzyme-like 18 [Coffea eugenioides]
MVTSRSSLFSHFSFLILALAILQADASRIHDDYLKCLQSQNSDSISTIAYTPRNTSYASILQSTEQNLRPASTSLFKPTLILTPLHSSEIQAAIRCAKKHEIQIRVRSGGHDYEGLSYASTSPFVIVDLRNISSISVDRENRTAWVEAGATLGQLYYKIGETSRELAFVAGACPTVGVGGHFSGGGYSMLSRKFGLSVDHIIDAKIIDVNGQILDRRSMGEDLFWAIRGGGGASFGIIIAWKVSLVSVPEKVTVFNLTKTSDQNATQLVYQWQHIADKIDENLLIRLFISSSTSPQTGKKSIVVSFTSLFVGGIDQLLSLMQKSFPELGLAKEDCIEMSWLESTVYFANIPGAASVEVLLDRNSSKSYFKGKSDYVKKPISVKGLEGLWKRLFAEEEEDMEAHFQLQFSPYGGMMSEISESATPFPHRRGNIFMIHYAAAWDKKSNAESKRHLNWTRRIYSYMAAYVSKSPRAAYLNYRDLDLGVNKIKGNTSYKQASIWGTKYFNQNFDRLVHVKTKVDPSNFFRNEQSIPPLS